MSVDDWSTCLAVPPTKATQLIHDLAPTQSCGAIIGPDEEVFVDAWEGIQSIDVAAIAMRYADRRPSLEFWEGAAVNLDEEVLDLFEEGTGLVMTNRSSALAGLDRVLLLPNGFDLLRGHAVGHFPSSRIRSLKLGLERVWKRLGGKDEAARILQRYLFGNANEDAAAELIATLDNALETATSKKLDVILLSAIAP
jgi:hypothetical protein